MSETTTRPTAGDYARYSDTVLFDVMYEAGTYLGGCLVELERRAEAEGDADSATRWAQEDLELARERRGVDARDRQAQIAALLRWRARADELRPILGLDVVG